MEHPEVVNTHFAQVCRDTPDILVLDNRGLTVREVQLYRAAPDEAIDVRATCHTHNDAGHLSASIDPRLATLREQSPEVSPNFTYLTSLSGKPLLTHSLDAGWQVLLHDAASRPLYRANQAGTVHTFAYDALDCPVAIYEGKAGSPDQPRVIERMVYGDTLPEAEAQSHNLKGQLVHHYDLGGLRTLTSVSLLGKPLVESRRLLAVEDMESDWRGSTESDWQSLLLSGADNTYTTQWTYNALGEMLTQTDAMGNQQRHTYLPTGQLKGTYLTQKGQAERVIVHELEYNAAGLKLKETAGNGMVTEYTYDPQSLRLTRVRTTRPTQMGRASLLQDLRYRYDPVGNVLSIEDASTATRFYKNQRVSANNQYEYDSLYQLIKATGRENDNLLPQGSALPTPLIPIPTDTQQLRNYTRTYGYDRGGNLVRIQHLPATGHGYTREMVVSDRSNRAVAQTAGPALRPADVEGYFDGAGNLKALATGQPLRWDGQSQLRSATLVARDTGSDIERYRYSTQGVRLSKTTETVIDVVSQRVRRETVIYLPGLELRQGWEQKVTRSLFRSASSATLTEDLHVLVVGKSGAGSVRLLHWVQGKPASVDNDVLRYSVDNHLGSSTLELSHGADILTQEEYYPYGGTAVWSVRSVVEAKYKTVRYSGKERDATGLYYYGYRYYQPWVGRWLNPDPAGTVDGLNLYRMVRNNPVKFMDNTGLNGEGFLYAPFSSPDIVIQAAMHNSRRDQNGKSLRVLISQNSQDRTSLEQYRGNAIATRNATIQQVQGTMNSAMQQHNLTQAQLANHVGVATFKQMISNLNILTAQVNMLNQLSITSNTVLSTLSSAQQHKLHILGHGSPGKNFLAADENMTMGMATASEVARQLATGGLEKEFIDIRATSCNSADTREPSSFQVEELTRASLPETKRTGLFGLFGKKRVVAEPFAQTLSNELSREGFGQAKVSGYHGAGVTFANNHAMRRLLHGQRPDVRASSVRRQF